MAKANLPGCPIQAIGTMFGSGGRTTDRIFLRPDDRAPFEICSEYVPGVWRTMRRLIQPKHCPERLRKQEPKKNHRTAPFMARARTSQPAYQSQIGLWTAVGEGAAGRASLRAA